MPRSETPLTKLFKSEGAADAPAFMIALGRKSHHVFMSHMSSTTGTRTNSSNSLDSKDNGRCECFTCMGSAWGEAHNRHTRISEELDFMRVCLHSRLIVSQSQSFPIGPYRTLLMWHTFGTQTSSKTQWDTYWIIRVTSEGRDATPSA